MKEEQERLEREEREREAKKPRHQDLDFKTLGDELTSKEIDVLHSTFSNISWRTTGSVNTNRALDEKEVEELRKAYSNVKIVSRAKVTQDRVYSSLYHPDKVGIFYIFVQRMYTQSDVRPKIFYFLEVRISHLCLPCKLQVVL